MSKLALIVLATAICHTAYSQEPVVWVASPWEHVLKSTEAAAARSVALSAARNEYEPFRIIVRAGDQPLADVDLVASPLRGPAGEIPAENVTLFREHYIDVFEPSLRSTAPTGWYPDALVPFVDPVDGSELTGAKYTGRPFDVEAIDFGSPRLLAAELTTPSGCPPFLVLGLSGFGNKLTLNSGFFESAIPKAEIEQLFELIDQELPR